MSVVALRILIFLLIGVAIYFGARRIWRDWRNQFKKLDEADRQRDLKERKRSDVATLKRSEDGVFRRDDEDR
jgi:hypothetical protein